MTNPPPQTLPSEAKVGDEPAATAWWWIRQVGSWTLLLAVLAALVFTIAIPRLTGAQAYTVLTSSMEPTYPPGTLIVVREVGPDELSIGKAITYQVESNKPDVITHRIVGVEFSGRGERTFITQGDHNPEPDDKPIRPAQVRGEVWYAVPYLGYANSWLNGKQRSILITIAVAGLLSYALWMFVDGTRDSRRERRARDAVADGSPETAGGQT